MLPFSSFSTVPALCGTWTPSSTNHFYVPPLSHLSLLCFVTFVFPTLRCYLYFILRCHLFLFINSYTLVLSFIPLTWWSLWAKRCSAFYPIRLFSSSGNVYRIVFWKCLNLTSALGCCHSHLSLLRWPSAEPGRLLQLTTSMFLPFLTFLSFVLSLSCFPHFVVTYISYFVVTFFSS